MSRVTNASLDLLIVIESMRVEPEVVAGLVKPTKEPPTVRVVFDPVMATERL